MSLHLALFGSQHDPRGVAKFFAGTQPWLFSNDSFTSDVFDFAVCIGNSPVARDQSCRDISSIVDPDGVGEDAAFITIRLLVEEADETATSTL